MSAKFLRILVLMDSKRFSVSFWRSQERWVSDGVACTVLQNQAYPLAQCLSVIYRFTVTHASDRFSRLQSHRNRVGMF
jgi:hypothetical protein